MFQKLLCWLGIHDVFIVEFKNNELAYYCHHCDWDGDGYYEDPKNFRHNTWDSETNNTSEK